MKKIGIVIVFVLTLSFLQIIGVPTSEATVATFISGVTIESPSNKTYYSRFLTLNATTTGFVGRNIKYSMSYSIDGQRYSLSVEDRPAEPWNLWIGVIIGAAALPELAEGPHNITVYAKSTVDPPATGDSREHATVYFTIGDTTPPIISNFSVENKTYTQLCLPLNFRINEAVSWMGYSIDNEVNMTLTGNSTLTGKAGLHSLVLYANDTAGNMGKSGTALFTINIPTPSPSPTQQPTIEPTQTASPTPIEPVLQRSYPDYTLFYIFASIIILAIIIVISAEVYFKRNGR
jgi:hypothetical protein